MIDYFAIALTHGLIGLAAWRLLSRPDLDDPDCAEQEGEARAQRPWLKNQASSRDLAGDDHA